MIKLSPNDLNRDWESYGQMSRDTFSFLSAECSLEGLCRWSKGGWECLEDRLQARDAQTSTSGAIPGDWHVAAI